MADELKTFVDDALDAAGPVTPAPKRKTASGDSALDTAFQFVPFDAVAETLGGFARRLEAAFGFGPGEVLCAPDETTLIVDTGGGDLIDGEMLSGLLEAVGQCASDIVVCIAEGVGNAS